MKLPKRKNDVIALARDVLNGSAANTSEFPDPPFVAADFASAHSDVLTLINDRQTKKAEYTVAVDAGQQTIATLKTEL